jgi:dTDP-4-amino-4,6-dideoxygalactose transaminase
VAAVVLVHIGGIIAPFAAELRDIVHEHGAALVEDAAHAHTSHLEGVGWAGSIGDIAAFSFFPTKVMTMGEGGMITTHSEALHKACKDIKAFGADPTKGSSRLTCIRADGTNGRVPEMSALLGLLECGRVRDRVAKRQALVAEYASGLAGCEAFHILLQPGGSCSYYKCIVHLRGVDKEFLRDFAKERGVSFTGEVYHLGVHQMPAFAEEHPGQLPTTEAACAAHVCPPLYPELSAEEVRRVCAVMREAVGVWKQRAAAGAGRSGYP